MHYNKSTYSTHEKTYNSLYYGEKNPDKSQNSDNYFCSMESNFKDYKSPFRYKGSEDFESDFNYERQEDCFLTFAARQRTKSKYNQAKKLSNIHKKRMEQEPKVKIHQVPIYEEEKTVIDQQKMRLVEENLALKKEIKCLQNYIKRIERFSIQSNKEQHNFPKIQKQSNQNLYSLSYSQKSLEKDDDEILSLLRDAEKEIKEKNEEVQQLKMKIEEFEKDKQKTVNSTATKVRTPPAQSLKSEDDQVIKDIMWTLMENEDKYEMISDKIEFYSQQITIVKDKFQSMIDIMEKKSKSHKKLY